MLVISAHNSCKERFEVFMAVKIQVEFLCVVVLCGAMEGGRRFGGTCCHISYEALVPCCSNEPHRGPEKLDLELA